VKKSQIRKIIIKKRANFKVKDSKFNFNGLLKLLGRGSKNNKIGLYYPIGSEVSTIELIKNLRTKRYIISLPVIEKNSEMSFYEWTKKTPLNINNFGIPEPLKLKKTLPSTLIIPLVAFDDKLNRLGYGGGFYDRFIDKFEKSKRILKIGLALSCQRINKVPTNKFDKKMNYIFTENKVYK
tara:strand:+ start:277 stop:819 length:543 start_codon:yes stop_codon:yes gene_type:complete